MRDADPGPESLGWPKFLTSFSGVFSGSGGTLGERITIGKKRLKDGVHAQLVGRTAEGPSYRLVTGSSRVYFSRCR